MNRGHRALWTPAHRCGKRVSRRGRKPRGSPPEPARGLPTSASPVCSVTPSGRNVGGFNGGRPSGQVVDSCHSATLFGPSPATLRHPHGPPQHGVRRGGGSISKRRRWVKTNPALTPSPCPSPRARPPARSASRPTNPHAAGSEDSPRQGALRTRTDRGIPHPVDEGNRDRSALCAYW